jgi:hypothetical protein
MLSSLFLLSSSIPYYLPIPGFILTLIFILVLVVTALILAQPFMDIAQPFMDIEPILN